MTVFVITAALWCGLLLLSLVIANARDAFVGAHDPAVYSADALGAFLPGLDMLGRVTQGYWSNLGADPTEQSVYLGLSVSEWQSLR